MDAPRSGIDGLVQDISRHRVILLGDRNPSYHRALEHLNALLEGPHADVAIVQKLARCWRARSFAAYYERPLLLLAALRHDALAEGPKHPLARGFASIDPAPEAVTRENVRAALSPDRFSLWVALTTRRVQTNEISRAVAWRWPAWLAGCDGAERPLALFDVGCAAGLNLVAEAVPGSWTMPGGGALPVASKLRFESRLGFDTHPLDVGYDEDVAWMRACIWPGEATRLARFDAAVAAMKAARDGRDARPEIVTLNAQVVPARLEAISKKLAPETLALAYQTFVSGYFEVEKQRAYARAMEGWIAARPRGSAVWIEMEIAGDGKEPSAEIVAHVRGSGGDVAALKIARAGYHPDEVVVNPQAASELEGRLRARVA